MSDTITLSHTDDVHSFYDYHVTIPDGLELSGEGVCVFTNYDNTSIMIPKEVFRDFVAHCQRMLSQWDFPK